MNTVHSIAQPGFKMATVAAMAELYLRSGFENKSEKLIELYLEDVEKLPSGGWSAYPRSQFAALLINEQPDRAVKMIEGTDVDHELVRAQGRLAFHCCQQHPELALSLLKSMTFPPNSVNPYGKHYRVAYRMASHDPESALAIADLIDEPNQKAWTLAQIADQLVSTNPSLAKKTLVAAVASLPSPSMELPGYFSAGETLAGMLPIFEKVAPEKMEGMIWRSVWQVIPRSRWTKNVGDEAKFRINTAAAIARYNRELAIELVGNSIAKAKLSPELTRAKLVFSTTSLEDLIPEGALDDRRVPSHRMREAAIEMLRADDSQFWKSVSEPQMLQWPSESYEER